MPSTRRNPHPQPVADNYHDDTATVKSTSALSSPIVLEVPITPRMTYPMIQTPPNSTQGPHMGNPPSAMSTSSTETMLLRMLQQMQADLARSTQIQAEMARTNAQMNTRLEELANENRELRNESRPQRTTRNSHPTPALEALTSSPNLPEENNEFSPQNLDDTPRGNSVTYAPPSNIAQPTPRRMMFEDAHSTPPRLGSAFRAQLQQQSPNPPAPSGHALHEPKIKEPENRAHASSGPDRISWIQQGNGPMLIMETEESPTLSSWMLFEEELHTYFRDPDEVANSERKLRALKMNDNHRVLRYINQFKEPPSNPLPPSPLPIVLEAPITPRTTYPTIQTPPNSTQGPHMGNPPSATSTSSTETMLLRMLQQMQADLARSTQIQAEMARTNAQMNARLEELVNENQELRNEVAHCNSWSPTLNANM
ncbi:hypothetical protein BS47DRAFT_1391679 [Hydnum rufescens UP504]|uniref:Retrotransposon gag domain-containing protein n=1 Tax=Hydnum rufescens UP504 TaxID=1448309 RepID=A0A9P6DVH7_9AGAM|nr:hypothetical protein BS47DRAFT_1391679 [Hydnum rufescens UP504]